eukprot:575747-Alexandrium_andersonii.AAC.1
MGAGNDEPTAEPAAVQTEGMGVDSSKDQDPPEMPSGGSSSSPSSSNSATSGSTGSTSSDS